MPETPFSALPDDARVWVFASPAPITGAAADRLVSATDDFVRQWTAHGAGVVGAADWRYDRFLMVAADEVATGVSGCSIGSLFHTLKTLERELGVTLLDSSKVWYREEGGEIRTASRAEFRELVRAGQIAEDAIVFDNTVRS